MGSTVFVGRIEELHRLTRALRRTREGEPMLVVVEGVSGSGKSALLRNFAQRLDRGRPRVCCIGVAAADGGAGYAPVAIGARELHSRQSHGIRGWFTGSVGSARHVLPEWLAAIPVVGAALAAIVATVRALRRRSDRFVDPAPRRPDDVTRLLSAAASQPVVLLLDDLDRADASELGRLEKLIRGRGPAHRLLVVAAYRTCRPGEPPRPIDGFVDSLPAASLIRCPLREFTRTELTRLLDRRFPHIVPPPSFMPWLEQTIGGLPGSVVEALDLLVHRSVIRFEKRRWRLELPPEEAAELAERSARSAHAVDITSVAPQLAALLRVAGRLPEPFSGVALATALERDELYIEDQLASAARQGLVDVVGEAIDDEGEVATLFRFRSGAVRISFSRAAASPSP